VAHPTARMMFNVGVSGAEQLGVFVAEVGGFGPRAEPIRRLAEHLRGVRPNTNVDSLPIEIFDQVRARMAQRGVTHREMTALRGTAHGGSAHFRFAPSRAVVADYARLLDDEALARSATSDLFWDAVSRVEPAGREPVYDLTVPGPASWLADGIVSHNSGAIEQDADAILFIYRDEYYNPETTDRRGIAELILAKQRNGPTGKVMVKFTSSCTRFDNLQPGDYDALMSGDDE
jgi:replicative DNA helicase